MDPRWRRVAEAIDADRQRLRLSWAQLARAAKMSPRTLYDLRAGERTSYQAGTLDRLELALQWQPGSVERVLAGGSPRRKSDPEMARIQAVWADLPIEVRRVIAAAAESYRA
jgi:hypothetical protein